MLVGSRKDSETYVRNKKKACEEVGIASFGDTLPEEATEEEVLKAGSCFANASHCCRALESDSCIFYFRSHSSMLWQLC